MGHREDLLEGAKRCLLEKGWRATARDIVAASGTNLASIGYHYGSKDALMRDALFSAMGDWADEMQQATEQATGGGAAPLAERFETAWQLVSDLYEKHRGLWAANFEAMQRADSDPEMRATFRSLERDAQEGLVSLFHGIPEDEITDEDVALYGPLYQLLVSGMIAQKSLNPAMPMSGRNLVDAMRRISADEDG